MSVNAESCAVGALAEHPSSRRFSLAWGRCLTAVAVTVSLIGVPLPANATGEGSSPAPRPLVLNEQPLSQLLNSARAWEAWPLASPVASCDSVVVKGEGTTFTQATADAARQSSASGKKGKGVLFWIAVGAGAGAATGFALNAADPACDQPDSLCPLKPFFLGITGGLMGLLFGFGR